MFLFILILYLFSDVNDCSTQSCQNAGTCVDLVNSFQCICNEGWEGALCNISEYCTNSFSNTMAAP